MRDCERIRNDKLGKKVVEELKSRQFDAYYFSTGEEAVKKIMELIPENHSISWGGSVTVEDLGIIQKLKERGNKLIDRDSAKTPEEREEIMHQGLNCGTFLMSSNAITEKGELFNIDGKGNRVASLIYGPQNVMVVAGINKIVADMDAAYSRVRHFAAPVNAARFCDSTPCSFTGECGDCKSPQCICCQMVTTRFCKPQGRIKVIIIGENLGF